MKAGKKSNMVWGMRGQRSERVPQGQLGWWALVAIKGLERWTLFGFWPGLGQHAPCSFVHFITHRAQLL